MILLAMGLLGVGVVDLIRWSPDSVRPSRAALAVAIGVAGTVALAALAGASVCQSLAVAVGAAVVLGLWARFDYPPLDGSSTRPLAWLAVVLVALFACSGSVEPISGPLARWYEQLGFGFVASVSVDQFVLGVSAALFMTASGNRVVRLVLAAAGVSLKKNESDVPGGRALGPLERLIVFAIVLAADPAAAAIVITGKGLLRFPEIRRENDDDSGPDARTEYFLIGTFASLLIAASLAALVSASS